MCPHLSGRIEEPYVCIAGCMYIHYQGQALWFAFKPPKTSKLARPIVHITYGDKKNVANSFLYLFDYNGTSPYDHTASIDTNLVVIVDQFFTMKLSSHLLSINSTGIKFL